LKRVLHALKNQPPGTRHLRCLTGSCKGSRLATRLGASTRMVAQYILAGIAAAGLACWYDFKSWQSSGS
jgi:hypothetical protein